MSKPYLVALGTACFDEYYSADSWVSEGDKLLVHPMEKKAGGMVANAASVMAGYGNSVYLVDFMNGGASNQELKENLASFGLNTSHIVTDDRLPDAKCIIVLTPKERTIFVLDFPRPKRVLPPQTQALLENAAYIYTTMAEIRRFENYEALLDSWRGAGAKIVFDLESTTFEDSSDVLFSKADVLLFNDIGLEKYAAGRDPDACIQALLDGGCTDSIPLRAFAKMGYKKCVVVLTRATAVRKTAVCACRGTRSPWSTRPARAIRLTQALPTACCTAWIRNPPQNFPTQPRPAL